MDLLYDIDGIDPGEGATLPGDIERERRQCRIANGITLPTETWESICGARAAGVPESTIATAAA